MRKITILLGLMLCLCLQAEASAPLRLKQVALQSDGTTITFYLTGNENFSYFTTEDGIPIEKAVDGYYYYAKFTDFGLLQSTGILAHDASLRTATESLMANELPSSYPTISEANYSKAIGLKEDAALPSIGKYHIPVILVQFTDVKFTYSNDTINRHLNGTNYNGEGGAGSVRDYFIYQSDSLLQPTFDIIGPITVTNNLAYYGSNSGGTDIRRTTLGREALTLASQAGTDFSQYPNRAFAMIVAGEGEQATGGANALWASVNPLSATVNGVTYTSFLVTNETIIYPDDTTKSVLLDGIGTFCHEFGHLLGLPDFYNTNGLSNIFGLDRWSIMDYGQYNNSSHTPYGYTAYERAFMGWTKLDTLKFTKQSVKLLPLGKSNQAYCIINPADPTGNEYYILENHQSSNPWYMTGYQGKGMLIYHVQYDKTLWVNNTLNNLKDHPHLTLIPADGILTTFKSSPGWSSYRGDPFPGRSGVTALDSTTTPSDTVYIGRHMGIKMRQIRTVGDTICFYYMCEGKLDAPQLTLTPDISKCSATWAVTPNATGYVVTLSDDKGYKKQFSTTDPTFTANDLESDHTYKLTVAALGNNDYLNSDTTSVTFQTLVDGLSHVLANTDDATPVSIYTLSGHFVGKAKANEAGKLCVKGNLYMLHIQDGKSFKIKAD